MLHEQQDKAGKRLRPQRGISPLQVKQMKRHGKKPEKANIFEINGNLKGMIIMKILYAAYGSNMNLEQMALRCPTAKIYGKGIIEGYKLIFKGLPGNSYATIEAFPEGKVPALIWDLQEKDEEALDYYEGYPRFYEKDTLKVRLENNEVIEVMVYIMTDNIQGRDEINYPSYRYFSSIKQGYSSCGFDTDILEEAYESSFKKGCN